LCGSQNCADAAFLPKCKFAPCVDILIRYAGTVARQAELIFALGWMAETGEDMAPVFASPKSRSDGFAAIAVGTGPLSLARQRRTYSWRCLPQRMNASS
jgi:cardiolipin synthase